MINDILDYCRIINCLTLSLITDRWMKVFLEDMIKDPFTIEKSESTVEAD